MLKKFSIILVILFFGFCSSPQKLDKDIAYENLSRKDYIKHTKNHKENIDTFLSQSPKLFQELRNTRLIDTYRNSSFESCIDILNRNSPGNRDRASISVEYVLNEKGVVISSGILNSEHHGSHVTESQIDCILNIAMSQSYAYKFYDSLPSSFLLRMNRFILIPK